jgi:glycosyltransferase involved in cell wall biosynthesis
MESVDWVVVPSIWWENSPLVIQEAFLYGRPVICSDIGGMAEKVTDGKNGLHFRTGDPASLAQVIQRAVSSPALWDELRLGVPRVYTLNEQVSRLTKLYRELLATRLDRSAHAVAT